MQHPRIVVLILLVFKGLPGIQSLVPDYCVQRVGCFIDASARDLERWYSGVNTSPLSCRERCKSQYLFAGTQAGPHCLCGQDFGMYGHRIGLCTNGYTCRGYPKYRCGGAWTNDIFMTRKTRQITHLGCFNNDLTHIISTGGENVNPLQCAASCRDLGYVFAGLQNGKICLCGNTYGAAGRASSCNVPCLTEGATNCGGTNVNSVYLTGKDDLWQSLSVASDIYDYLPVHLLLDDSETTCIDAADVDRNADFIIKFSTNAYYQRMTPGITMLVTMENSTCLTDGIPNVLVYLDNGVASSGFYGKFKKCSLFETLSDGLLNTCVFKCVCVNSSCKEVFVRFMKSQLAANARLCEIRSCYSV